MTLKKITIYIALIILTFSYSSITANNITTEVPEAVKKAFNKQYRNATEVKWRKVDENEYEAEFIRDGKDYEASYTTGGKWRETGMILAKKEIPVAIRTSFMTLYPDAEMKQVVYIEKGVRGAVYEVEYMENGTLKEVYFNPDGDRTPDFTEEEEEKYDMD